VEDGEGHSRLLSPESGRKGGREGGREGGHRLTRDFPWARHRSTSSSRLTSIRQPALAQASSSTTVSPSFPPSLAHPSLSPSLPPSLPPFLFRPSSLLSAPAAVSETFWTICTDPSSPPPPPPCLPRRHRYRHRRNGRGRPQRLHAAYGHLRRERQEARGQAPQDRCEGGREGGREGREGGRLGHVTLSLDALPEIPSYSSLVLPWTYCTALIS
jgi:hypothetical protein